MTCSVTGCGKPTLAKALCSMHYNRVRRGGGYEGLGQGCRTDLGFTGVNAGPPVELADDGFWSQVDRFTTERFAA